MEGTAAQPQSGKSLVCETFFWLYMFKTNFFIIFMTLFWHYFKPKLLMLKLFCLMSWLWALNMHFNLIPILSGFFLEEDAPPKAFHKFRPPSLYRVNLVNIVEHSLTYITVFLFHNFMYLTVMLVNFSYEAFYNV